MSSRPTSFGRLLRRRRPLVIVSGVLAAMVAVFIFILPVFQAAGSRFIRPSDLVVSRVVDVTIAIWCLWIGSAVGSFLNVVAWRMPRGESVNGRSHCPRCQTQLKARDNFPVFGWLILGGRCRRCHLPISPRYPIVEAAVGLTLAVPVIGEVYLLSLPYQDVPATRDAMWAPRLDSPLILATATYHAVAIAASWAVGLIRLDGVRIPNRLIAVVAVATIVPLILVPSFAVVSWQMDAPPGYVPTDLTLTVNWIDSLARVLLALVAAVLIARTLARSLCPAADLKLDPLGKSTARLIDSSVILGIPIVTVGWQAAPAVAAAATLLAAVLRLRPDPLARFAIAVPIVMSVQITAWRWLETRAFWPGEGSPPWVFLAWSAVLLVSPLWLRDRRATP